MEDERRKAFEAQKQKMLLEQQKRLFFKQVLDDKAYERIANIRLANPELYDQLYSLLAYLQQNGQIGGKVSEEKLLALIGRLRERKREPTIEFSRK